MGQFEKIIYSLCLLNVVICLVMAPFQLFYITIILRWQVSQHLKTLTSSSDDSYGAAYILVIPFSWFVMYHYLKCLYFLKNFYINFYITFNFVSLHNDYILFYNFTFLTRRTVRWYCYCARSGVAPCLRV